MIGSVALIEALESRQLLTVTPPAGFTDVPVATGLVTPTAMEFAPDGRLFVSQQGGEERVIDNGVLQATPFVTLPVDTQGERGLLGIAFDPNFGTNHFVYIYHTTDDPVPHNQVSRFTEDPNNPDVALAGSETDIFDLDPLQPSVVKHNGGAIHFGADGKLYIAVGDNGNGTNSQSLTTTLGKILRINSDGTIPQDNPFVAQTTGKNQAIWAMGLRNPYTFAIDPQTGQIFIDDVGENTTEEIDPGVAGANYGWPQTEGPTTEAGITNPVFSYRHDDPVFGGCAVVGGTFYDPTTSQFPASFQGKYFFSDLCGGYIALLDPTTQQASIFAKGIGGPVDLKVGPDGSLYYLDQFSGADSSGTVEKIVFDAAAAPVITKQPASVLASVPTTGTGTATFAVTATGETPLSYQWQLNDQDIAGATSSTLTVPVTLGDNGAQFRVSVSNAVGTTTSAEATLGATTHLPPVVTITSPKASALFKQGGKISFGGTAVDPQGGKLKASAFSWVVDFVQPVAGQPAVEAQTAVLSKNGVSSGSFKASVANPVPGDFYRISLTATDKEGLTTTVTRDVLPQTSIITLSALPAAVPLAVAFDGVAEDLTAPVQIQSVVGVKHILEAPPTWVANGVNYKFKKLNGGKKTRITITTDSKNKTYVAQFTPVV